MEEKIVVVSGGFDPIHDGHIDLIVGAKGLGSKLVCILNTDEFLIRKKGKVFQSLVVRKKILEHIREVDEIVVSVDVDQTVCKTLEMIKPDIFANGGDRRSTEDIPETEVCQRLGIQMIFSVGGGKANSSSELLRKWNKGE